MKRTWMLGILALLVSLTLVGCDHALHNGTEMAISQIKLTGLPTSQYPTGLKLVFSYNTGNGWIHDNASTFTDATYGATVAADGSWTLNFSPALQITSSTLTFLLIDADKNWNTIKVDKKHSGKSGGDVNLDNTWAGAAHPNKLVGTVSGDDVAWAFE